MLPIESSSVVQGNRIEHGICKLIELSIAVSTQQTLTRSRLEPKFRTDAMTTVSRHLQGENQRVITVEDGDESSNGMDTPLQVTWTYALPVPLCRAVHCCSSHCLVVVCAAYSWYFAAGECAHEVTGLG